LKVWTFLITGGEDIRISAKRHLDHPGAGHRTIWKMVGPEAAAQAIESTLEIYGCTVERYTEEQSPEQEAERRGRLGLPPKGAE
jgi:ferredoxin-NADP reductase